MAMRTLAHHAVKNVHLWNSEDMDIKLQHGDKLFMEASEHYGVTMLFSSEAIKTVTFDNAIVTLQNERAKKWFALKK